MNSIAIKSKKNYILKILSGVAVAVSITLMLILLFAVFIRFVGIDDKYIFPINQIIKVISLFVGAFVCLKGNKEKGLIKGLILGFAYYLISYILFAILQGSIAFTMSNFYDLILTTLMGGIIGLIVVHIGK